ncbi:hypothetical protein PG991_012925 [Apiospora marii]|uniref:Uncharacterized protein n=1 Tax=Apiospora marii TaxID=335849 RepID=A0ABR1RBA8_9PEZI
MRFLLARRGAQFGLYIGKSPWASAAREAWHSFTDNYVPLYLSGRCHVCGTRRTLTFASMSRSGHSFAQENMGNKDEGSSNTDVIVYVRRVAAAAAAPSQPPIGRHPPGAKIARVEEAKRQRTIWPAEKANQAGDD